MKESKRINKLVIITVGLIALILAIICISFALKPKTPKAEQLKSDFVAEELDVEKYSITDFEIETETDGKEDFYKAIVSITYNNEKVEYLERYHFTYSKYDEWVLEDIEDYEEDSWIKKPLVAPTIEEFEKNCISKLYDDGQFTEYDKLEALKDKTEVDLEDGKTTFIFAVENSTAIQKVSGEIEFNVVFDDERGRWSVENYNYKENYNVDHNLIYNWSGKGKHCGYHGTTIVEKDFTLNVTDFDDGKAFGILTYEGKQYSVSGKIDVPDGPGYHYSIDMFNVSEKMRIEGFMNMDGEMYVTVDTAYNPDSMFYYPKDRYDVDLFVEE